MLNLKKGLALVLAAATAFTFAPVANLGNAVQAEAADKIADTDATQISLVTGETKTLSIADFSKISGVPDGATATAVIKDKSIATFTNVSINGTTSPSAIQNTDTAVGLTYDKNSPSTFTITAGAEAGSTTLTLTVNNKNGAIATQTITISVEEAIQNLDFGSKGNLSFTQTADNTFTGDVDSGKQYATVTVKGKNLSVSDANSYTWKYTAKSSDTKVATVSSESGNVTTPTNADGDTLASLQISPKAAGTTSVTVTVTKEKAGKSTSVATGVITVKVQDSRDTLSVKYDADRNGKDVEAKVAVKPDEKGLDSYTGNATSGIGSDYWQYKGTNSSTSLALKRTVGQRLYLDTVSNKTAKLNVTDSMGRAYKFRIEEGGITGSAMFQVDNTGLLTVTPNADDRYNSDSVYVVVSVDKTTVDNKTVAGLEVWIPVTVYKRDTVSLEVKEGTKSLGKTVGGAANSDTAFDALPTVYLSLKDKTTADLDLVTNSGAEFATGVVNDWQDENKASDKVSYSNGKLTALKAGKAVVTVSVRNNNNTYGSASVRFAVVVVTKNAANKITAPAEITLTKASNTQTIAATTTYKSTQDTLSFDIVDALNSDKAVTSNDITVDAKTGKVTYTSSNSGTAYVRIQGKETSEALAPNAAYVTVHYSADKDASTLKVTSDKKLDLKVGETSQIVASGTAITYASSDDSVASVDASGKVEAKAAGAAIITVSSPADDTHVAGQEYVTVLVSQEGEITAKPAKVTGLKVSNKKGAYVSVKWTSQGKNINYRIWKKVGNGKWVGKNVAGSKATLSVKKGAKVQVKVKAYVKDANGKTTWGPTATKAKTFKTDKK